MTSLPFDSRYVAARAVLLDALEAMPIHRHSLILVGAQAIYLRVQDAGLDDVVPHTLDADLAIAPELLVREPALGAALLAGGFASGEPGRWATTRSVDGADVSIMIDLMVPQVAASSSGRAALVPGLGPRDARSTSGLEAALFDRSPMMIEALDPADGRSFELQVGGVAALLIANLHKFGERIDQSAKRQRPLAKDALDAHRLRRGERIETLVDSLRRLLAQDAATVAVVRHGLRILQREFAAPGARGAQLVGVAGGVSREAAALPGLTASLASSLLEALGPSS